jgi:cell division septation protein DedD
VPWRSNGDYYSFKEEAILAHAPPVSGVYGLYNIKHQILIGNASNIREALLHHSKETHFQFRRLEPTGFTFEVCPPEARELRTQELIWEFDPIIQRHQTLVLGALWRSWTTPSSRAFNPQLPISRSPAIDDTDLKDQKRLRGFQIGREQFAMVAAGCGVVIFLIGIISLLPHVKTAAGRMGSELSFLAKSWTSSPNEPTQLVSLTAPTETLVSTVTSEKETGFREPNAEIQTAQPSEPTIEQPTGEPAAGVQTSPGIVPGRPKNKESSLNEEPKARQKTQTVRKEEARNPWAVQALATTDRRIATAAADKLQAKGYEAYVVEAELKGQTWYRVRAGNFTHRQQAETLRIVLQSKEGFRDAFVAANSKSEILIAASHQ